MDIKTRRAKIEEAVNTLAHHLRESGVRSHLIVVIHDEDTQEVYDGAFRDGVLMEGAIAVRMIASEAVHYVHRIEQEKIKRKLSGAA